MTDYTKLVSEMDGLQHEHLSVPLGRWLENNWHEVRAALKIAALPLVGVEREDVARVIDPVAFAVRNTWMELRSHHEDREKAFAKADAVLALPKHTGQPAEGWQLVPKEPTPEILNEMVGAYTARVGDTLGDMHARMYRAALSVAPASPSKGEPHELESSGDGMALGAVE